MSAFDASKGSLQGKIAVEGNGLSREQLLAGMHSVRFFPGTAIYWTPCQSPAGPPVGAAAGLCEGISGADCCTQAAFGW